MANNDKVIAAFLVSLGLFSTTQATQYISALSAQDKQVLFSVVDGGGSEPSDVGPRNILENGND